MALIVESGAGDTDAEAYIDVAFADDYFTRFGGGAPYTAATTEEKEVAIRNATRWVDNAVRFLSVRIKEDQALEFPRAEFTDLNGRSVTGVPGLLKDVTAMVAGQHLQNDINSTYGALKSESFGDSSQEYATPVTEGPDLQAALKILSRYGTRKSGVVEIYRV